MPTSCPDVQPPSEGLLRRLSPPGEVVGVPGVIAHQAPDLIALWQAWEDERRCVLPPPFWAVVWPAARVLARFLRGGAVSVAGRRVLEIGCGGAVVAIAAALGGAASVLADDVDPVALHLAGLNGRASGVSLQLTSADYASTDELPPCDLVLLADFFYERSVGARLMQRLQAARHLGAEVVIADAGRPFTPAGEVLGSEVAVVDPALEGRTTRTVRILRLA